jgi:hypothetical protein
LNRQFSDNCFIQVGCGIFMVVFLMGLFGRKAWAQGCSTPSFAPAVNFTIGDSPYAIAVADFNGDGKHDLVTTNWLFHNVSVLLGDGSGGFSAATNFDVEYGPTSLAVGDFNLDGKPDLAVPSDNAKIVSVFLNTCTGATLAMELSMPHPNLCLVAAPLTSALISAMVTITIIILLR